MHKNQWSGRIRVSALETMPNQSHKAKYFLQFSLKILVVLIALFFIVYRVTAGEDLSLSTFMKTLQENRVFSFFNIFILVVLSLLNWVFEIKKWQSLSTYIRRNSYGQATKESLASFTAAIFTPSRIGEYGAKALFYQKGDRTKVLLLNFLGNISQLFFTTCFGVIGLIYLLFELQLPFTLANFLWVGGGLVLVSSFYWIIRKKKWNVRGYSLRRLERAVKSIPKKIKLQTLFFAFLRYLLFTHQFYFFLLMFNVEVPYWLLVGAVAAMFFLSSAIPTILIFDAIIKGGFGVWIFSFLGIQELVVLVVVLAVWILNFGFPALLGSYFVLKYKPPKKAVSR